MFELSRRNGNSMLNPFREMEQLEKDFFGDPFTGFFDRRDLETFKSDITDCGDHYELEADLPGFQKEDIRLELKGDDLVISAERHSSAEEKNKDGKVIRMERSCGSFRRSFNVANIQKDGIRAGYENGVLKLTLPKLRTELPESRVLQID